MKYARATFLVFVIVFAGTACSLERDGYRCVRCQGR